MQSRSEIIQRTRSKCCEIKIISCTCDLFIKRFPALHLNIFVPNVFNKRNLPEIQDKNILCLAFNHVKESVSSKKSAVRLLNKTVSKI